MKTRLILHTCPWLPAALTYRQKYHQSLGCQPAACTLVYYREHKAAFPLLHTTINQAVFVLWWIWCSPTLAKVQRYFLTNALIEVCNGRDYRESEISYFYEIWNAFSRFNNIYSLRADVPPEKTVFLSAFSSGTSARRLHTDWIICIYSY